MDRRPTSAGRPVARRGAPLELARGAALGLALALAFALACGGGATARAQAAPGAGKAAEAPPAKPVPPPRVTPRPLPRPDLRRPNLGVDVQAVRADSVFAPFRAHLAAGRLAEARAALDAVMATARQPVEREVAEFDRIELDFFAGQFDSAAAQYRTFAQSHVRGYLTNDAIGRMFLLDENSGTDEKALRLYAQAAQEARAGRPDSAAAALRLGIERYQGSEIEDDLRLFLGDVGQRLTPPGPAVEQYRRVAEMDDSPLAAAALLRMARYYSLVEVDSAAATAACEEVLARYPDSIESGEARKLLAEIRRGGRPAS